MNWTVRDSPADVDRIKKQLNHYLDVREIVRKASGEQLDLKPYEADMRHLRARSASRSAFSSPFTIASRIARPLLPMVLLTVLASLIFALSSSF
jgi:hypothetical protein